MTKELQKFLIVPQVGVKSLGIDRCVMLADYTYFADLESDLDCWCSDNGAVRSGMIIDFPSEAVLSLFVLRWS